MNMAEYSKAKTCVWWDIENCEVPRGWDAHGIAQNVGSALLNMNYSGPVSILAYGDTNLIPHHVQQALSSTGVGLNHVPAGVKDASDKKILVDMLLWAVDNPAPANIMLISGDRDFSNALHQLSMRRYTILLAQPPRASAPLVSAAKNVWLWTSLASGGPPITSGESSQLINNGRCNVSNPVSELAGNTKDHKTRDNHVPRGESVTSSDRFRAHLSDKRHTSKAAFVASHKAYVSVSAKPIQESTVVEPVLCTVCQISCTSKEAYARHTYSKRHQNNLVLQSDKVENMSREAVPVPKEVLARQKNKTKAQPPHASAPLVAAAKNVWLWTSLASGGPPITSGESSQLVNNGRCNVSNPVSELAGDTKDHKTRDNHVPRGATGESVTSSDSFRAHLSDKRHTSQAAFVASHKAYVSVSAKPIQESTVVEPVLCTVCQISCTSKEAYARHTYSKRHRTNLELQSGKAENVSRGAAPAPKEVLARQKSKKKARGGRTRPNAGYACRLCNVACQSQVVYDSHLKGQKHAAMLSKLDEALIDFNKLQKKSVGEKSQPRETITESKSQSQDSQEKHVAMVNQSERGAQEKSQPVETTITESQLQSQNTEEETKYLEKRSEELREILLGTSKSSVNEKFLRTKDQPEIVTKQVPNGEAKECFDGIVKPVNQSQGATYHWVEVKKKQEEVMERREIKPRHKLCHLCVVICDIQGASTLVCDNKYHWPNQKAAFVASDDDVWCQVCQIHCISKAAYEDHTNGRKHRHKLELQSAKNEYMSKKQAKLSEDNAEKGKDQTAFDSLNHAAMVKDQTENAKLREALEQEDQEEVKEVNTISENLVHVFNGLNRESRVFKEPRGCLDVIPERVPVSPDVNVTGKFEDESKHKQEREKECEGGKEHLGEAAKREESKEVQVDNLWTRLWWGKS